MLDRFSLHSWSDRLLGNNRKLGTIERHTKKWKWSLFEEMEVLFWSMWKIISCTIEMLWFYEIVFHGILFKISIYVTLPFRMNLSSKCSAEPLVIVLFYFLQLREREFDALLKYYAFMKVFFTEYCLKFRFTSPALSFVWVRHLDFFGGFASFRSGPQFGKPALGKPTVGYHIIFWSSG